MSMGNPTVITATPDGYEVVVAREFDAPVAKVWRAYTDPDLFIKWCGPRRLKGRIDAWELQPGGRYAYTHVDEDGSEYAFQGFNHVVDGQTHIVSTFEFMGIPGHVALNS